MGYQLSDNLRIESAMNTLRIAIKNRQYSHSLIHHSDRGLQYCHRDYINLLQKQNVSISMTTKYDPYENAVAERINGILKDEFDIGEGFINRSQASKWIKESIQLYNQHRPHLSCGFLTPCQAHKTNKPLTVSWKWSPKNSTLTISILVNLFQDKTHTEPKSRNCHWIPAQIRQKSINYRLED